MPRFEPFAGLRYATEKAGSIDDVSCPPYDVITPERRSELMSRSPYNMVRLEMPEGLGVPGTGEAPPRAARATLDAWKAAGVLRLDPQPAFYGYRTTAPPGRHPARHTVGVVGALTLEPPGAGILPHEETTPGSRAGHSRLLSALRVNVSPIWVLSPTAGLASLAVGSDDGGRSETSEVVARALDEDGVLHEVWPIVDPGRMEAIGRLVGSAPLVLADGHHRYETALAYHQARLAAGHVDDTGSAALMAYAVELSEEQLHVQAIHRLVIGLREPSRLLAALRPWFSLEPTARPDPSLPDRMVAAGSPAIVTKGGTWLARPRVEATSLSDDLDSQRVDAALTQLVAVPGVSVVYQHGWEAVSTAVDGGQADAALLLRPPTLRQILELSRDGRRMPPKTSFFWPKPRSGLILRDLDA
jgi:uncharacterized protein (DUF1015 family)